jgi:Dockerin type I domain
MRSVFLHVVLILWAVTVQAAQLNIGVWLNELQSDDPNVRQAGFTALETAGIIATNDDVKVAFINLLLTEETYIKQQATLGVEVSEGYGAYFSDVVNAVASLHDNRSVGALSGVIQSGDIVTETLAGLGAASLPSLFSQFQSTNIVKRFAVATTIGEMLTPENISKVSDSVSRAYIRIILSRAGVDSDPDVSSSGHASQAIFGLHDLVGDLNDDGEVNCNDVAIVKAAFGKKTGQAGFDARADMNLDGIVNVLDLAFLTQKLPAGSRCP